MRWIRPGGIIAFLVMAVVIGAFWLLLAPWLIKGSIEYAGSRVVGAQVDVASVNLSLSPFGISLTGVQVADPDHPMQNLVEFTAVESSVELLKLLMGQVIVNELNATGVRFNTPRSTSGEIRDQEKSAAGDTAGKGGLGLDSIKSKLPSVEEILAREQLVTTARAEQLKTSVSEQREAVDKAVKDLPDEDRIKAYEERIKALTSGKVTSLDDLQKRKAELDKLKSDIRAEKKKIKQARKTVQDAKSTLSNQFSELQKAPGEDLERIRARYGLDSAGTANITRLIFGDTAKQWLQTAQTWYGRLQRFLPAGSGETPPALKPARGEGRFVHFPTAEPLPTFLIRTASVQTLLPVGDIDIRITDITHQPWILGRPIRLQASADKLEQAKSLRLNGVFNHVEPADSSDTLDWELTGWQLENVKISGNDKLPLTLRNALVNVDGSLGLSGGELAGKVDAAFQAAQWSTSASEGWAAQVANTLKTIDAFSLKGSIAGSLDAPAISLTSDLDKQIKRAAISQLQAKQAALEQKLKKRLDAQVEDAAGPYKDQVALLTRTEGSLDERVKQLQRMLEAELQSAVDSQKKQVEEKLKDKLKGFKF